MGSFSAREPTSTTATRADTPLSCSVDGAGRLSEEQLRFIKLEASWVIASGLTFIVHNETACVLSSVSLQPSPASRSPQNSAQLRTAHLETDLAPGDRSKITLSKNQDVGVTSTV